jgi:histidinol-phosphate aminotransferase
MKIAGRFENFPAYTPIEPVDVLSARLGIQPDEIIKLDANENPYGPCEAAKKALSNLAYCHLYPDPENRKLRTELQKFTGVDANYLMAGAGADELIDLILRVLLEPQQSVINLPPTFGMYDFDTRLNNGRLIEIQRNADFSINFAAIDDTLSKNDVKVIFITSPNNPDGGMISDECLKQLLKHPVMVVLDEAYLEFTGDNNDDWRSTSKISWVPDYENLIILRTFSKWAGLAGLRVGYGAFPLWLMKTIWVAKQPYSVNVAASQAAVASLQNLTELEMNIQKIRQEKIILFDLLKKFKFLSVFPSQSNFILCKLNTGSALEMKQFLINKGILVRHYNTPMLKNFIRISVGRPKDTAAFISALEAWK